MIVIELNGVNMCYGIDAITIAIATAAAASRATLTVHSGLSFAESGVLTVKDFVNESCWTPAQVLGLGEGGYDRSGLKRPVHRSAKVAFPWKTRNFRS
jgi:hypothetical protein